MASDRAKNQMAIAKRQGLSEDVIFHPSASGLVARTVTVIVDRDEPDGLPHGQANLLYVTALNDEIDGISSDPRLTDTENDRIEVAQRLGGPTTMRSLGRFVQQDPDYVKLEIS